MKNYFPNQLTVFAVILLISSFTINYTQGDSIKGLSDYLTKLIDRGIVAQALKQELKHELEESDNKLLKSNKLLESNKEDNVQIKPKRFSRWPNAATRTRVKLLNNHLHNDAPNLNYHRRKELEKNMLEKNRMYQYFHGK